MFLRPKRAKRATKAVVPEGGVVVENYGRILEILRFAQEDNHAVVYIA